MICILKIKSGGCRKRANRTQSVWRVKVLIQLLIIRRSIKIRKIETEYLILKVSDEQMLLLGLFCYQSCFSHLKFWDTWLL